ncbi:MAG: amino acid racemase [Pseudomonadota bacterium]
MPRHIGIVACSAEGAALCYRTICAEAPARLGPHTHPEISMHTPPLAEYVSALDAADLDAVARLMQRSAEILAGAGADFLICPDNTIHQAMDLVRPKSPLPWLHIANVTLAEASRQGLTTLAILGTASLVRSDLYPEAARQRGLTAICPSDKVIREVDRIIFEELVPGHVDPASRKAVSGYIRELEAQGCDGVVLGCTELPLLIDQEDSSILILDTTRLLARAALDKALD